MNRCRIDAELVTHELLEHRLMPLAMRYRAGNQCHAARAIEPYLGAFDAG